MVKGGGVAVWERLIIPYLFPSSLHHSPNLNQYQLAAPHDICPGGFFVKQRLHTSVWEESIKRKAQERYWLQINHRSFIMFEFTETIVEKGAILKISGIMVDPEAMALNEKVKELLQRGIRYIVLEMSAVRLMNSSFGLGVIAGCWASISRAGGKMIIANPSPKVLQLLKITRLNEILEVAESVEAALSGERS